MTQPVRRIRKPALGLMRRCFRLGSFLPNKRNVCSERSFVPARNFGQNGAPVFASSHPAMHFLCQSSAQVSELLTVLSTHGDGIRIKRIVRLLDQSQFFVHCASAKYSLTIRAVLVPVRCPRDLGENQLVRVRIALLQPSLALLVDGTVFLRSVGPEGDSRVKAVTGFLVARAGTGVAVFCPYIEKREEDDKDSQPEHDIATLPRSASVRK